MYRSDTRAEIIKWASAAYPIAIDLQKRISRFPAMLHLMHKVGGSYAKEVAMILLQLLVYDTIRIVLKSPLAWLCAILVLIDNIFDSMIPPLPESLILNCINPFITFYIGLCTTIGLIVIGSEPPVHERLTIRRLLLPDIRVASRVLVNGILLFLALIPAMIPTAFNNVARATAEIDMQIKIPNISLWWTIPLALVSAPFVITLEMAMRDLVLNRSGLTSAIKHVWPYTLQAFPLLTIVVGLRYPFSYLFSYITNPLLYLVFLSLLSFFSIPITRAFVYLESKQSQIHTGMPA